MAFVIGLLIGMALGVIGFVLFMAYGFIHFFVYQHLRTKASIHINDTPSQPEPAILIEPLPAWEDAAKQYPEGI